MMSTFKWWQAVTAALLLFAVNSQAASVILNEYNAVDSESFLGGGTAAADEAGGRASDSYFGRVAGNGGDWFELVVVTDHLDMRNWSLSLYSEGVLDETLDLTDHAIWSDLRSGTIITVSEDVPSDVSYDPAAGDWWINVQASDDADGLYIEASSFPVDNSDWQIAIRNAAGTVVFGPAGEGVSPASGVGGTEVVRLEALPTAAIAPSSGDYDTGDDVSTFGAANVWGVQDLASLRKVVAAPSSLILVAPNGSEALKGGSVYDIVWNSSGAVGGVAIEFSTDQGRTWSAVYPPNEGNTGVYPWLVPTVDSDEVFVRIVNAGNPAVYDTSNAAFSIYECAIEGDVTGDCAVDLEDLAVMAGAWLDCANPYDAGCL